jgi:6,7-dimethyl-8-ribityllumazine synthase
MRFCVVAAQWNEEVVKRLVDGAVKTLTSRGAKDGDIEVWWVPGSLELPSAAQRAMLQGVNDDEDPARPPFDAVVAVGCVIRGETEHFRIVSDHAAAGLMRVALDADRPVTNGVIAAYDTAQAESRSGGEHGNVGSQAALAAVRMVSLRARTEGA